MSGTENTKRRTGTGLRWLVAAAVGWVAMGLLSPVDLPADIYKYVDEEGVIHLTNVPTDGSIPYVLVLREKRVLFKPGTDITRYDHLITASARRYNVEPSLIKAVIKAESNFNHRAVSRAGARGLMQLMPATALSVAVEDVFHPEQNIEGGVRYLRYLLNLFNGNLSLALAAYNAGEKTVIRHGNRIPPIRETQDYVQRVLSLFQKYRSEG